MNRRKTICMITALYITILLLNSKILIASTYYVDKYLPSASDSNPGTLNLPWITIQHAAETLVAGDTVFIRTGMYNESIYIENDGNVTAGHIVFTAYPGEIPIIDGTDVTDANNGVVIDKSYIKFTGIEIRNWNGNGIWIVNADHLEISDCVVHEVTYGIGVADGTHDFEFNRIEAHHFSLYGFDVSPSDGADCYNGTFNDCLAYTGRDRDKNVDGFALGHGSQHDFVLNRCVVYDVFDGFDISSRNSTLNCCLAYSCWNGAFKLWQDQVKLVNCIGYGCAVSIVELDWDGIPGVTTLTNCTFYNGQTYTIWIENHADALHMFNCILAGGDNIGLAFEQMGVENYQGDYNLFQNNNTARGIAVGYTDEFSMEQIQSGAWTNYSNQDAHSLVSNSDIGLFVNPTQFNLHLLPTSIGVDHGTSTGAPIQDYEGNPRPSGNGYDIGAYEYQYDTGLKQTENIVKSPSQPILHQNYPNPFNPVTKIRYVIPIQMQGNTKIKLFIYNTQGQLIQTLVDEEHSPGIHEFAWGGMDESGVEYPSGIYFYTLVNENFKKSRKMIKLK